jgi:hypothetical protein
MGQIISLGIYVLATRCGSRVRPIPISWLALGGGEPEPCFAVGKARVRDVVAEVQQPVFRVAGIKASAFKAIRQDVALIYQ